MSDGDESVGADGHVGTIGMLYPSNMVAERPVVGPWEVQPADTDEKAVPVPQFSIQEVVEQAAVHQIQTEKKVTLKLDELVEDPQVQLVERIVDVLQARNNLQGRISCVLSPQANNRGNRQ